MKMILVIYLLHLFLQVPFLRASDSQKILTIQDFITFEYPISQVSSTPDGSLLAYVINKAHLEGNKYQSSIWQTNIKTSHVHPLITHLENARAPRWSPDPQILLLAFLATPAPQPGDTSTVKSEHVQLHLFIPASGETQCLTQMPFGIETFCWSTDGKSIIFLTKEFTSKAQYQLLKENEQKKSDGYVYELPLFKKAIWLFDISTNFCERIFPGDYGIHEIAISPDRELIVFSTNYTGQSGDEEFDLWLLSVGTRQAFQLTDYPGAETAPAFSPDGQKIAFLGQSALISNQFQTELFLLPVTGGISQNLTATFDQNITAFKWSQPGDQIFIEAHARMNQQIYRLDLMRQQIKPIIDSEQIKFYHTLEIALLNQRLYFIGESGITLPEIYYLDAENKAKKISHFSKQLTAFQICQPETFTWTDENGQQIEGFLIKPIPLGSKPPYPLMLVLHGGPFSRFTNQLIKNEHLQLYAQQGYLVFAPNPAGSAGYGEAFARAIQFEIGQLDYQQIMRGVDELIAQDLVDPQQMFLIGGSYGGYLVNWIISQTSRFKAAVALYGIFDLAADWSCSIHPNWQKLYLGGYFWEKPELYQFRSPATFVEQIQTPLLLLHGEQDQITPVCNSKAAYRALKILNQPVELVLFPRENHGINREPNHEINKFERIFQWFEKYKIE